MLELLIYSQDGIETYCLLIIEVGCRPRPNMDVFGRVRYFISRICSNVGDTFYPYISTRCGI